MSLLFLCSTRPQPCPLPLPPDLELPLLFSLSPLFAQLLPQLGVLTVAPEGAPGSVRITRAAGACTGLAALWQVQGSDPMAGLP